MAVRRPVDETNDGLSDWHIALLLESERTISPN